MTGPRKYLAKTRARHATPRAYYVSVRSGRGAILALGPFATQGRALGLVESVRRLVDRARLDPWAEFGYGTCSLPVGEARLGAMNELLGVGPDRVAPSVRPAQGLGAAVMERLGAAA